MAEEEKTIVVDSGKKKKGLNKFLIIGIIALIVIAILIVISAFVAKKMFQNTDSPRYLEENIPVEMTLPLEEFLVSTRNNQGIIKAQLELGLSKQAIFEAVQKHKAMVRDQISRILVGKTLEEANIAFSSGELQKEIRDKLNEIMEPHLDTGIGFFGRKDPGVIARVDFTNFLAK